MNSLILEIHFVKAFGFFPQNYADEIPWGRYDAQTIRGKVISEREQLPLSLDRLSKVHQTILEYGLQYDPLHRELTFNHIRDILYLTPEVFIDLEKRAYLEIEILFSDCPVSKTDLSLKHNG